MNRSSRSRRVWLVSFKLLRFWIFFWILQISILQTSKPWSTRPSTRSWSTSMPRFHGPRTSPKPEVQTVSSLLSSEKILCVLVEWQQMMLEIRRQAILEHQDRMQSRRNPKRSATTNLRAGVYNDQDNGGKHTIQWIEKSTLFSDIEFLGCYDKNGAKKKLVRKRKPQKKWMSSSSWSSDSPGPTFPNFQLSFWISNFHFHTPFSFFSFCSFPTLILSASLQLSQIIVIRKRYSNTADLHI